MKKAIFYIAFFTAISSILGFARELVLSYFYGTSSITDIYIVSLSIPTILLSVFAASIRAGFIPVYKKLVAKEQISGNKFLVSVLLTLSVFSFVLILIVFLFTEGIIGIFASGFNASETALAIEFTRITIISLFPMVVVNVFNTYYNANNKFLLPAFIYVPYNIALIATIIIGDYFEQPLLLAYGFLIAAFLQVLVYTKITAKIVKNIKNWFDINKQDIKVFITLILPIILSVAITDINQIVDKTIASNIVVGGITSLNYASKLNKIVITVVVTSIITVFFPDLTQHVVDNNKSKMVELINKTLVVMLYFILPITVIFIVFSEELVVFLFGRGEFDQTSIILTSSALFFYSWSIIPNGMKNFANNVFFANEDTKTPVVLGVGSVFLNIILNIIFYLYTPLGIGGLALATSISAIVLMIALFVFAFRNKYFSTNRKYVLLFSKLFITTAVTILVSLGLNQIITIEMFNFDDIYIIRNSDIRLMIIIVLILLIYVGINRLIGIKFSLFKKGEN